MDIEGAEYGILRKLLNEGTINLIDILHVEFHDRLMPAESEESTNELNPKSEVRKSIVWL